MLPSFMKNLLRKEKGPQVISGWARNLNSYVPMSKYSDYFMFFPHLAAVYTTGDSKNNTKVISLFYEGLYSSMHFHVSFIINKKMSNYYWDSQFCLALLGSQPVWFQMVSLQLGKCSALETTEVLKYIGIFRGYRYEIKCTRYKPIEPVFGVFWPKWTGPHRNYSGPSLWPTGAEGTQKAPPVLSLSQTEQYFQLCLYIRITQGA